MEIEVSPFSRRALLGAPAAGPRREGAMLLGHLEPDWFRATAGLKTAQAAP